MATTTMTKTTRENIAACAAHGFYFWSDHPDRATLWATDDNQRWHTIKISRRHSTAEHVCHRHDPFTGHCGAYALSRQYDIPSDMAGAAQLMGLTEPEVDLGAAVIAHNNLKKVLRKHSPEFLLSELNEIIKEHKRRRPAVVISSILHDPTYLVGFTVEELTDALGHTDHDIKIRAELDRRQVERGDRADSAE